MARSRSGLWQWFRRREFSVLIKMIQPKAGIRIVDLGCGAGFYSIPLRDQYGMDVTGVDSSSGMLRELARRKIPCVQADVSELSALPSQHFAVALAAGVLEFVEEPAAFFPQVERLLSRHGRLVILVPTGGWPGQVYEWMHRRQSCPAHSRSVEFYIERAREAGFQLTERRLCTPISTALALVKA